MSPYYAPPSPEQPAPYPRIVLEFVPGQGPRWRVEVPGFPDDSLVTLLECVKAAVVGKILGMSARQTAQEQARRVCLPDGSVPP